jgi:predicted small lipoprotein YifL
MRARRPAPWPIAFAVVLFTTGCGGTGPLTAPPEAVAPSLVEAKRQVSAYVDSGRYEADIAAVTEQARAYLESRVPRGGRLAIVVDVDETALSTSRASARTTTASSSPGPVIFPVAHAGWERGSGWPRRTRSGQC